jgi:hypothetical protein
MFRELHYVSSRIPMSCLNYVSSNGKFLQSNVMKMSFVNVTKRSDCKNLSGINLNVSGFWYVRWLTRYSILVERVRSVLSLQEFGKQNVVT